MRASLAVSRLFVLVSLVMIAGCVREHRRICGNRGGEVPTPATSPQATVAPVLPSPPQPVEEQIEPAVAVQPVAPVAQAPFETAKPVEPQVPQLVDVIVQNVPPTAYQMRFRLIPGSPDGSVKPFYISETEVPWDVADIYIFKLDEKDTADSGSAQGGGSANADAVTRPTKPYLPPDRGFGHEGYAAITMSFHNAKEFCNWLTKRSTNGRVFRLPTEAEWEHACGGDVDASQLAEYAWFSDNANDTPHPIGKKKANKFGVYDMLGNVQEWCVAPDGTGVTRGGSYRDAASKVNSTHREPANRAWNASDPQVPKSKWWLADGPFVGFRVVCEVGETGK